MILPKQDADNLNLESGRLCLEFANAADRRASDDPEEQMDDYEKLVFWAKNAGLLTEIEADQLLDEAAHRPNEIAGVVEQAVSLRAALYRIFTTVAVGNNPDIVDLSLLNDALAVSWEHLQLVSTGKNFTWEWVRGERELDQLLWPVAQSAAELLTSPELTRVGICANPECSWLFLDTSRNHSRRWCDMGDCGNRAKARRHYHRKRSQDQ